MTYEKKIQFGAFTKRDYAEIRRLLKAMWKQEAKEFGVGTERYARQSPVHRG